MLRHVLIFAVVFRNACMTYNVFGGTLSLTQSINQERMHTVKHAAVEQLTR